MFYDSGVYMISEDWWIVYHSEYGWLYSGFCEETARSFQIWVDQNPFVEY